MFSDIHIFLFWRLSYIYNDFNVTDFFVASVIFSLYEYIIRRRGKYIDKIAVQVLI
jgi:hypothetical protein